MGRLALFTLGCLLFTLPALAQDTSYTYSPEGCDFVAEFPAEPGFTRRCPSNTDLPCFEMAQYTDRTDINQVINVEMSCNPISEDVYNTYNRDNMEVLILQMATDSNLSEPPPITYQEEDGIKIAGASGLKTSGFADKIFISQIWVSPISIMTIEGEMSLDNDDDGDKKFADIMRSVRLKEVIVPTTPEKTEPTAQP